MPSRSTTPGPAGSASLAMRAPAATSSAASDGTAGSGPLGVTTAAYQPATRHKPAKPRWIGARLAELGDQEGFLWLRDPGIVSIAPPGRPTDRKRAPGAPAAASPLGVARLLCDPHQECGNPHSSLHTAGGADFASSRRRRRALPRPTDPRATDGGGSPDHRYMEHAGRARE